MLSIKKVIGKNEKDVTMGDVCNKLCFLSKAVEEIFKNPSGDPVLNDNELCGLQYLHWEALKELEEMINTCPSYGTFKEYEELDEDDKTSVSIFIGKIKDRKKAEQEEQELDVKDGIRIV